VAHELGDGSAIARAFRIAAEMNADRLRIIELDPSGEPALGSSAAVNSSSLSFLSASVPSDLFGKRQVLKMRGSTASRPARSGRSKRHRLAKYVRAALAESPR
jgi:hypothetical protein